MTQDNSTTRRLFIGLIVGAVFGLGIGLLVGLVFAYRVAPIEWTDGAPQDLREDYAAYYWELVAESYARHGDLELARKQLGVWDDEEKLGTALDRAHIEAAPELQMVLESLESKLVGEASSQVTPAADQTPTADSGDEPSSGISLLSIFLWALAIVLVLVIVALLVVRMRKRRESTSDLEQMEETPEWLATLHPEESAQQLPALGHFITSFALGNDTYDESFSIETGTGEFLGECGVGISETIGVGDPDKVTAFEIWLFDKNDIRTVTQVLMSEHAFNDPELRASLAPKGEAVLARVNAPLILETATLRLDVMLTESIYGTGPLPPNSFFERLTVELVARTKEPGAVEIPDVEDETAS